MDIRGLYTATQAATNVAALMGTAASADLRRYIYKIHTNNLFNGVNELTISRGTALAAVTEIDTISHVLIRDQWLDPVELKVDSAPLYILEAGEYLWLTASAAGNIDTTIWYEDAP